MGNLRFDDALADGATREVGAERTLDGRGGAVGDIEREEAASEEREGEEGEVLGGDGRLGGGEDGDEGGRAAGCFELGGEAEMAGGGIDEGGGEIGVDDCLEDLGVGERGGEVGDAETVGAGYAAGPREEETLVVLEAGELGGGLVVFGVEVALAVVVAAIVPRVAEALGLLGELRPVDEGAETVLADEGPEEGKRLLAMAVDDVFGSDAANDLDGESADAVECGKGNLDVVELLGATNAWELEVLRKHPAVLGFEVDRAIEDVAGRHSNSDCSFVFIRKRGRRIEQELDQAREDNAVAEIDSNIFYLVGVLLQSMLNVLDLVVEVSQWASDVAVRGKEHVRQSMQHIGRSLVGRRRLEQAAGQCIGAFGLVEEVYEHQAAECSAPPRPAL